MQGEQQPQTEEEPDMQRQDSPAHAASSSAGTMKQEATALNQSRQPPEPSRPAPTAIHSQPHPEEEPATMDQEEGLAEEGMDSQEPWEERVQAPQLTGRDGQEQQRSLEQQQDAFEQELVDGELTVLQMQASK